MKYQINTGGEDNYATERLEGQLMVNGMHINPDMVQTGNVVYHIINNHKSYRVEVINYDKELKTAEIKVNNNVYYLTAKDQFDTLLEKLGLSDLTSVKVSEIKAPMPGMVLKVFVTEGSEVKKGDNLFVLEAMKMENIIKSPADVTVKNIKIKPGDKVEKGQILMQF